MKTLSIIVAALCLTSIGLSQSDSLILNFDFTDIQSKKSPPEINVDFVGIVTAGSWTSNDGDISFSDSGDIFLSLAGLPASMSFAFTVAEGFELTIDSISFLHTVNAGSASWELDYDGSFLGDGSRDVASSLLDAQELLANGGFNVPQTPLLTGITGTNNFTFQITSPVDGASVWSMDDFHVFGSVSAVPETSTVVGLVLAGFGCLALKGRRKAAAAVA